VDRGAFRFGIVMSRASPAGEKLNLAPRECAIDNTSINLGANAILPQLQRPKPGSVDPVTPYKLCQLVDLLHCQKSLPCRACSA